MHLTDWLPERTLPDASTEHGSFLFLIGVILNQNISGELAWRGVERLSRRIETHPRYLARHPAGRLESALRRAPAIHPFGATMARAIGEAAVVIRDEYGCDTRRLWREAATGGDLRTRLTRFRQIGRHKADVAVYLLTEVYGETDAGSGIQIEERCPALLAYLAQ